MKKIAVHENADVMPFEGMMDDFTSGVFVDGQCLDESLFYRAHPATYRKPVATIDETCIFGGYLFANYGHFILESLTRYYAFKTMQPMPLVFLSPNRDIKPWQEYLFKLLGVRNKILLLYEPTRIKRLIVAPSSGDASGPMTDAQFQSLAVYRPKPVQEGRKVWLSRSALQYGVCEEKEIEAVLKQEGWEIVHPEQIAPLAQVKTVAEAQYVAGFDGSALYSVLFCTGLANTFLVFSRRNSLVSFMMDYITRKGATLHTFIPKAKRLRSGTIFTNWSLDPGVVLQEIRRLVR